VILLSIVGARPQFVKIGPLVRAIESHNARLPAATIEHRILHTGQHYDAAMSDIFFAELDLPCAWVHLGVGSGSHGVQSAAMLAGIERVLQRERPDVAVVYGDTNSTLAGALAASKLGVPCAHVEAGLRSFDRRMPEEINRVVADHVCDALLAPTANAMQNLAGEGLAARAVLTGDLMYDSASHYRPLAQQRRSVLSRLGLEAGGYGMVTLHRAENTDDLARLQTLLEILNDIAAEEVPLVFPLHPRTAARLRDALPGWRAHPRLVLVDPLAYLDNLALLAHARVVLTDSGGLQKEAMFLGCPCVTLRTETEWIETLDAGANVLAGSDPARIRSAVRSWAGRYPSGGASFSPDGAAAFGAGQAAQRIVQALLELASGKRVEPTPDARDANVGRMPITPEGVRG
jgi:UDP-N-acetylglucosamine 2-epimerase